MQEDPKLKKIIIIQAWFRGQRTRNQVRKLAKSLFKRKHLIKQLVQTQERYIRDLSTMTSDFKATLLRKQIINKEQSLVLFSNIEEIRTLNELFFATIFNQAQTYSHFKIIFDKVQKEVHFFKLYFQYFNNFTHSSALVAQLTKDNKDFAQFLNNIRVNPKYSQLGLSDYLIKPVQRLPKYVLVMKELRRVTPCDHPDLENIDKVLQMFQKVNISNNQKLNQVVNNYKLSQIERNLHLSHIISQPGVEFILQEPVSLLNMEGQLIQSTLYLLNTQLIVSKRGKNKQRMLANVPFKHGGQILSNQQHFYYKNSFTVQNGEGDSCTLIFQTQEQKEKLLQKIYNEIIKTQQRNLQKLHAIGHVKSSHTVAFLKKMNQYDLLPQIQVLGTQQRSDALFKYTIYIIEVKIKNIKQKIFMRFSQLLALQDLAKSKGLIIKNQIIKTTWLLNHEPRKIEERKMNIQRFLKELLSKQQVVEQGGQILTFLGLPQQFYKLPSYNKQFEDVLKKSQISERSTNSQEDIQIKRQSKLIRSERNSSYAKSKRYSIFSSIPLIKQQFEDQEDYNHQNRSRTVSIQDILQANEITMGHFTRLSQKFYQRSDKQTQIHFDILIPWLQNEKGFVKERIIVNNGQKVYFLIEKLAQQLQLQYFKDFRLYLERKYFCRMLDDDQSLSKVAQQINTGKYLIVLKKMIYLTQEMEERQIKTDRVRLKIIASQAIYDCKKDKYILTYHSILKLSALIGLAQLYSDKSPYQLPQLIDLELLRSRKTALKAREMVANDFTSFYDGSKAWQTDYQRIISHLYNKIRGISRQNSQTFRLSKIKDDQRQFNTTNMAQLAAVSIIYQIKENPFYGSISFIVQISQEFRHILIAINKDEELTQNRNCWLVIKYHEIYLYSISLSDQLFTVNYDDIHKIVSYPASIEMHLRGKEVDTIKLKTTSSFSIREIIMYYKQYNEMIRKMEQNDKFEASILQLVREQGSNTRESVLHRGTTSQFFIC